MAYIEPNLLRIMQEGRISATDFLDTSCKWHKHASLDDKGEIRPCTICLEPLRAIEPISFSSLNITPTQRFRGRLTINNKCSHIFHTHCLYDYIKHGNTCPICRAHWFDSAAEVEKAWDIWAALQALDSHDYTRGTRAQWRIKITAHAVVFSDMPSVVAHWLSQLTTLSASEHQRTVGRTARSEEGARLVEAIIAAFRQLDGRKMRLNRLVEEIVKGAVAAAIETNGKGTVREDHGGFIIAVAQIVVGYYAYSQGMMDKQPSRRRRMLSWLRLI